jgi:hypothetical protein
VEHIRDILKTKTVKNKTFSKKIKKWFPIFLKT